MDPRGGMPPPWSESRSEYRSGFGSGEGVFYVNRGMASGYWQRRGLTGIQTYQQIFVQRIRFLTNMGSGYSMDGLQLERVPSSSVPFSDQQMFGRSMQFQTNVGSGSSRVGQLLDRVPSGLALSSDPSLSEMQRRRRGRPREYATVPNVRRVLSAPSSVPQADNRPPSKGQGHGTGQPSGSGRGLLQFDPPIRAMTGKGFTQIQIHIREGEDITSKIVSATRQGRRAVWIISASGSASSAILAEQLTAGRVITVNGPFTISSLSGFFMPTDRDGSRIVIGGLCVFLTTRNRQVRKGLVMGELKASSPVQVVLGSMLCDVWSPSTRIDNSSPQQQAQGDADAQSNQNLRPNPIMTGWSQMVPMVLGNGVADINQTCE